jgi:hypothetical protein
MLKSFPYHVKVCEGSPGSPVDGASFDCLDPQVVGEHERKYGNALQTEKKYELGLRVCTNLFIKMMRYR